MFSRLPFARGSAGPQLALEHQCGQEVQGAETRTISWGTLIKERGGGGQTSDDMHLRGQGNGDDDFRRRKPGAGFIRFHTTAMLYVKQGHHLS